MLFWTTKFIVKMWTTLVHRIGKLLMEVHSLWKLTSSNDTLIKPFMKIEELSS